VAVGSLRGIRITGSSTISYPLRGSHEWTRNLAVSTISVIPPSMVNVAYFFEDISKWFTKSAIVAGLSTAMQA